MKRFTLCILLVGIISCGESNEIMTCSLMPVKGSIGGSAQLTVVCGEKEEVVIINTTESGEVVIPLHCEQFYITVSGDGFYGRSLPLDFSITGTPDVFVVNGDGFHRFHQLPFYEPLCVVPFDRGIVLIVEKKGIIALDLVNMTSSSILNSPFNDYVVCGRLSTERLIIGGREEYMVVDTNGSYIVDALPENIIGYSFIEYQGGVLLVGGSSEGMDRASTYLIDEDGTVSNGPTMNFPRSNFQVCKAGDVYVVGGGGAGMEIWNGIEFKVVPLKGKVENISGMVCSYNTAFVSTENGDIYSIHIQTGEISELSSQVLSGVTASVDMPEGGYIIDVTRAIKFPELYEFPLNLTGLTYISGVYFRSGVTFLFTDKGTYISIEEVKR